MYSLQRFEDPVTLREVVDALVDWRPEGDDAAKEWGEWPRAGLRDEHILPMDDFGVINHDREETVGRFPVDVSLSVPFPWPNEHPSVTAENDISYF